MSFVDPFPQFSGNEIIQRHSAVHPDAEGFVGAVYKAYNDHHSLIIHPDDVWLEITAQFAICEIRGKESLGNSNWVVQLQTRHWSLVLKISSTRTLRIRKFANGGPFFQQNHSNRQGSRQDDADGDLPNVLHVRLLRCGIPRITLEGTRDDWVEILSPANRLFQYGSYCKSWSKMLLPVLQQFMDAYDAKLNLDSGQNIWSNKSGGSGPRYTSGWITAFAVFELRLCMWDCGLRYGR
ncbi:hypothetical protein BJ742DRAFT_735291 [Cladochytrium replicatum]|nr:hypothetical protein BJ742DRAFT_735291 [Cladochytrium replicatum]